MVDFKLFSRRITLRMEEYVHSLIFDIAFDANTSFSDAVTRLVKIGLMEHKNYGFDISHKPFKLPTQENSHDAR